MVARVRVVGERMVSGKWLGDESCVCVNNSYRTHGEFQIDDQCNPLPLTKAIDP